MPDTEHVITLVSLLHRAHIEYKHMVASGFDRSRAANEELSSWSRMDETGKQAASVWLDFLDSMTEAQIYDDMEEELSETVPRGLPAQER